MRRAVHHRVLSGAVSPLRLLPIALQHQARGTHNPLDCVHVELVASRMCPIFLYDVYCEPFLDPHLSKHGVLKGKSSIASYHTTKDGLIQQFSAQLHTLFMHLSVYSVKHCAILRHLVDFQRSLYHLCLLYHLYHLCPLCRCLASYAKREDDQASRLSCPSFPKWSADDAPGNFSRRKHSTTLPVNPEQPSGFEERQVCSIHRRHQHRPVQVLVAAFARGLR